jgi:GTP pyrophosphokinase
MQFTAEVGSGEQLRGALSHLLEVNGVFEVRRR